MPIMSNSARVQPAPTPAITRPPLASSICANRRAVVAGWRKSMHATWLPMPYAARALRERRHHEEEVVGRGGRSAACRGARRRSGPARRRPRNRDPRRAVRPRRWSLCPADRAALARRRLGSRDRFSWLQQRPSPFAARHFEELADMEARLTPRPEFDAPWHETVAGPAWRPRHVLIAKTASGGAERGVERRAR